MATQKKRELFDAAEYAQKMDVMIANLRTRTPGEPVGKVGKNDILVLRREALQKLLADGYTVNQIAEAMKDDVFSILPKTITEIIKHKNDVKVERKRTVKAARIATTDTKQSKKQAEVSGAPEAGSKATFQVKPDREDL